MGSANARPYKEIGHRIADLRREAGRARGQRLTQREVAEAVGVATGTVTAWEAGKQRPEGENLEKLAAFFRVPPELIVHGDSKTGTPPLHVREAAAEYLPAPEEITPPNYEGLGIEVPERDRLHPRPRALFDRFMHQLIDMGLGREDLEYWGRMVLAPIAHLNTLHRGRHESDATTEQEQTWVVEGNVETALRILKSRRG